MCHLDAPASRRARQSAHWSLHATLCVLAHLLLARPASASLAARGHQRSSFTRGEEALVAVKGVTAAWRRDPAADTCVRVPLDSLTPQRYYTEFALPKVPLIIEGGAEKVRGARGATTCGDVCGGDGGSHEEGHARRQGRRGRLE